MMLATVGIAALPEVAQAENLSAIQSPNTQQFEIQALEEAYEKAVQAEQDAEVLAARSEANIEKMSAKVAAQQERADEAVRNLYELQSNRLAYADVLLGTKTFDEFVRALDYYDRASKTNVSEVNKLNDMVAELKEENAKFEAAKAEAKEQADKAHEALQAVQSSRSAKQADGQAYSLAQDGNSAIVDGADWTMTEKEFVAEWTPRIDAYLAGTPMAGLGEAFAEASWRYCVDPRWSPAISNTESSKGAYCIRPHNAWGWGATDSDPYNLALEWGSWEEAIDAHVRGLAEGYGYTISVAAAQKYCSKPESWYKDTLSEMAQI